MALTLSSLTKYNFHRFTDYKMEVLAKLLGTLLVARVFALTKPQLLTFSFLNIIYTNITHWLQWAHQKITETPVYRWAKQLKTEAKARFTAWFN